MMRALVRVLGPDFVLKTVAASEYADRDEYAGQPDAVGMSEEAHRHAGIVQEVANRGTPGQSRGNQIAAAGSCIAESRRETIYARPCSARTTDWCRTSA
jgi:hypothetical protein